MAASYNTFGSKAASPIVLSGGFFHFMGGVEIMCMNGKKPINGQDNILDTSEETDQQPINFSVEFTKNLLALEAQLHSCEDPSQIAIDTLKAGAEFYGADWCGIIECDFEMEAWAPVFWYDAETQGMTETAFRELEDMRHMERWIEALYACKPMIIPDTSVYKESHPFEYEVYSRCKADSILAVPFWKNPIGFMIVRNPTKYNLTEFESGFLQVLAFVVFSSVTEIKLLNRTSKAFSPENIKRDNDVIVNVFGGLEIYTSKGLLTEDEISSPSICRFFVYMLLHGARPVQPRIIMEELWPEDDIDNAGTKIKSVAYRLQNAFGMISDYRLLVSTPLGYQLNPELNIMTDMQRFDDFWVEAQNALTLQTKIELLKRTTEVYRGNIYPAASSEHWLMAHELSYKYKCLGIYTELMKAYYDSLNYASVQYYASLALKLEKANVDAYYWMIRTMREKDSMAMAKGELQMAEHVLTAEEYQELLQRLDKSRD